MSLPHSSWSKAATAHTEILQTTLTSPFLSAKVSYPSRSAPTTVHLEETVTNATPSVTSAVEFISSFFVSCAAENLVADDIQRRFLMVQAAFRKQRRMEFFNPDRGVTLSLNVLGHAPKNPCIIIVLYVVST